MNMIVRNLPRFITEKELLAMFLPFGKVSSHNLVKEAGTGQSKGFGFVEMPENAEAAAAIRELNNKLIGGQKIRVKAASQRDDAPFERRERPQQDRIERRFTSGSVRTEARGARRPAGGGGRDFATPQRSESRDGTGATWTRSRAAEGGSRTGRTPGRGTATPQRSENRDGTGATWTRSTAAEGGSRTGRTSGQGPSRHTKTPGRESATPQRSESRDGTGATWTRSRAAEGGSRTGRTSERGSAQPARPGGSYRSRFEKTEAQGIDRPFRGGSTGRPAGRGATQPGRSESNYRARPGKTGSQEAKPFRGGSTPDSRPAKRTERTPARPIKIGRSGARQNKPARRGKQ